MQGLYETEQEVLDKTNKAGEELKGAAKSQAKATKNKITFGLAVTGAVAGTIATMGAGGALIGGAVGGVFGRVIGKKKQGADKARIENV